MSFIQAALVLVCAVTAQSAPGRGVRTGSQVLRDEGYASLAGHRVAILSNPTGVFPDTLEHIVGTDIRWTIVLCNSVSLIMFTLACPRRNGGPTGCRRGGHIRAGTRVPRGTTGINPSHYHD